MDKIRILSLILVDLDLDHADRTQCWCTVRLRCLINNNMQME